MVSGEKIGPYTIVDKLGAGGMGQVYRATDTKLKRQVAVKILPPSLAADADRLARFQREAEVLASLDHPNIAAIHGLEESAGVSALVMELVEGDDLSQRIGRGAIPIDEALLLLRYLDRRQPESWWCYLAVLLLATLFTTAPAVEGGKSLSRGRISGEDLIRPRPPGL